MIFFALALLCLSGALFTVPPIVARGWSALEDWSTRPEPKILMGGLVALTACIVMVPMAHQGLISDTSSVQTYDQAASGLRLI